MNESLNSKKITLDKKNNNTEKLNDSADVSFTGKEKLFTRTSEYVLNSNKLKKFIDHFEFDDASMSVSAMAALLYGFCYPTRILGAPDKYDRRETNLRDLTSFGAILFAAKALSRGFSKLLEKASGLALTVNPADHNENLFKKYIRDYFSPVSGVNVLSNKELESKYVNIHAYKNGIHDFFDFITENGGNLKKMLMNDTSVATHVETVLGKSLKDVTSDKEIKDAFKNISGNDVKEAAKDEIIKIFKNNKNSFVRNAKLYNSFFTFLSTIAIVPLFMIWLAKACDKMTRNAREKDAEKQKTELAAIDNAKANEGQMAPTVSSSTKITMQGFLNR